MEVYLDNSATTRVFPQVAELMTKIMCEDYGNPSSLHLKGVQAEQYLRRARETLAKILKVDEKEIYFTSGGTESDNMAIMGCALAHYRRGKHLITTQIEHPAVMNTMRHLETVGYTVTYLPVDGRGQVSLDDLRQAMTPETILVSMMHTNNEIGALEPVAEAGEMIKRLNPQTLFHVDAVQGFGKARIHPRKMKIDMLSASGHKIHGPKGVGLLYLGEGVRIKPIVHGGGQQKNLRSGTDNVPGAAGFALAAQMLYEHYDEDISRLYSLKAYFMEGLRRMEGKDQRPALWTARRGRHGAPYCLCLHKRCAKRGSAPCPRGGRYLCLRRKCLCGPQASAFSHPQGHWCGEVPFGVHHTVQLFGRDHRARNRLYIAGFIW